MFLHVSTSSGGNHSSKFQCYEAILKYRKMHRSKRRTLSLLPQKLTRVDLIPAEVTLCTAVPISQKWSIYGTAKPQSVEWMCLESVAEALVWLWYTKLQPSVTTPIGMKFRNDSLSQVWIGLNLLKLKGAGCCWTRSNGSCGKAILFRMCAFSGWGLPHKAVWAWGKLLEQKQVHEW
jgi:hypothetical protein